MNIRDIAETYFNETVSLRRNIHRYPELCGHEERTSALVKERLRAYNIPYIELPGYAILGVIDSGKAGKTLALRADMDGLPIQEMTDITFRSCVEGCGHLCGHDCHTASLIAAARILNERKESFSGKVQLMFQPSEEGVGFGAREMVAHGVMEHVDAVMGVHLYTEIEAGKASVQAGSRMAASLRALIEVNGIGGHSGTPHKCVDANIAACAIAMNLQSIVSREIDPHDGVAITIGTIKGGVQQFAVSDHAELALAIKFLNPDLHDMLIESITRIATETAKAYRATCKVDIGGYNLAVINDPTLSAIAENSLRKLYGETALALCPAWSASEDFSQYAIHAPSLFALVGCRNEATDCIHPAHHPRFKVDERSLEVASALYAQFALDYLNT